MKYEYTMPKLGHLMEEGTIALWRKKEGDWIEKGDSFFDVETDKTVIEVESVVSGILIRILVGEGETVSIHAPLAIIDKE
jgi:pyruvate/2-oxoglutarate dehydrogenase complex dihydrolipoamide acyltransferase (E2) component